SVREQLAAGLACAERVGCWRCGGEFLLRSAEALARIGDHEEARRMLTAWDDRGRHEDELDTLVRSHAGALAEHDAAARAAQLEAVVATAERSPYRLEALWARLDLGLALAHVGDHRAVGELGRTAGVADELGAGTVKDLTEHALRSLGVRTWRRAS